MSKVSVEYIAEEQIYNLNVYQNEEAGMVFYKFTEIEARDLIRAFVREGVSMSFPDQSYGAGELAATKQHLEDLRKIVFEEKA